jgi:hypothetical protein
MSVKSAIGWGAATLAVVLATGLGPHQDWEMYRNGGWDTVCFTIKRFEPGRGRSWSTFTLPFSRFRGLPGGVIDRGGKARFEYVQDEGKLLCEGSFAWGKGTGSLTFVPDPRFPSELKKLGYDAPNGEQVFSMMMSGVSLEFAREVHDAGLTNSIQQLADLQMRGLTADYIRDARREGYTGFSLQDYIDLRERGIGAGFLRDLKDAGYTLSAGEIVRMYARGVNEAFLHELKRYGLQPKAEDLVRLRAQGVTPGFLDSLKAAGYDSLSPEEIVALRAQGVNTGFIQAAHDLGHHFSTKELVELHSRGVDAAYLRKLQRSGMRPLSAEEIAKLKMNGVD